MTGDEEAAGRLPLREIHARSKKHLDEWLDFPAHVHQEAYAMADPPRDRPRSRGEFLGVLKSLDIPEENISLSEKFGYGVRVAENGDRFVIAWEAHTEYYNYQIWHVPDDKTLPVEFGPIPLSGFEIPRTPSCTRIASLDIVFRQDCEMSRDLIRSMMPGPHVYGSRVFGEDISVVTSFTPDAARRVRYLVFSRNPEAFLRHLARIADSVVTIENYYHLLLLPFPDFSQAVDRIHQLERHHLSQREAMAARFGASDSAAMQGWVNRLAQDFLEVSRFAEAMRFRLSASVPYNAIIHRTVSGLQEKAFEPYLPLSDYVLGAITGVADGYQQLIRRVESLESAFQEIISVIRTRVNLMQQEQTLVLEKQNMQLLSNVDRTTKSQAILQHTVEGLSIIVIAYYLSGLAGSVFKALEHLGWIRDSAVATGISVPASLGISFLLIWLGRRVIRRMMASNSDRQT